MGNFFLDLELLILLYLKNKGGMDKKIILTNLASTAQIHR